MRDQPAFRARGHAEELRDFLDLRRRPRRKCPAIEAVGALQDGFAVGPENGRRVEGRVEGHAQQRQAAADAFLVRAPPDGFEVPDHQRAEVRQRAACIDEGDHQDAAGKPLKRHRAIALIAKLEGRHDHPGDGPARHRRSRSDAAARGGDPHVLEPAAARRDDQRRRDAVPFTQPRRGAADLERHAHGGHQPTHRIVGNDNPGRRWLEADNRARQRVTARVGEWSPRTRRQRHRKQPERE